ncbi:hypothetical protein CY34DRAFT_799428 [Suillus luteus UH-Slu-Lm8-n1]|uniref:Uncharacterized protein n=1 Tax=Suillus luteus UH-Slu-Lm8-n1 TaxID=930992 RepID=A0A0D0BX72_9AGAM|nr:hypothetical protein CY34DRAFT_799428 [Suillus luteus UH-Slu-Lm8-n1]
MVLVARCFRGIKYGLDVSTDISVPRSILAGQRLGAEALFTLGGSCWEVSIPQSERLALQNHMWYLSYWTCV